MLIDLSHRLDKLSTSYPDDPAFSLLEISNYKSDGYTNYQISCGLHIGTHIDGLSHMSENDEVIGDANLNSFTGEVQLLNFENQKIIDLSEHILQTDIFNKIILIYTGFDKLWGNKEYYMDHPILTPDFARFLIMNQVKVLGIDFPSPDKYPFEIHKNLLKNRVYILENLTGLSQLINKRKIHLTAFPLNIAADSSPVRAIAQFE